MKFRPIILVVAFLLLAIFSSAYAHFGAIIPEKDLFTQKDGKQALLSLKFFHPFEGHYMNLEKPNEFMVYFNGKKINLLDKINEKKEGKYSTWESYYRFKRPGDYIFFMGPKPYWEPAEDSFIIHYTKVIVNFLGMEQGWDAELGVKTEIIPITRPYGLWTGNVFQGVIKLDGKVVPNAEVEVEYYNKNGSVKAPADSYITQVIKADDKGVFTYAIPKKGWWGFAALNTADYKLKHNGKNKAVELGAVLWVHARDME